MGDEVAVEADVWISVLVERENGDDGGRAASSGSTTPLRREEPDPKRVGKSDSERRR